MNTQIIHTSFNPSLLAQHANLQVTSLETRAIALHKWYLSEKLGRDVGMKVAELDYRLNIQKPAPPMQQTHWFLVLLERLAANHGVRALAQANYTARGMAPYASPARLNFGQLTKTQELDAPEQRAAE